MTYHYTFVDQIDNQVNLAKEQTILDDHEDKTKDLTECLEDLVVTTEHVMPHASDKDDRPPVVRSITEAGRLSLGLSLVHDSLTNVKRVVGNNWTCAY